MGEKNSALDDKLERILIWKVINWGKLVHPLLLTLLCYFAYLLS